MDLDAGEFGRVGIIAHGIDVPAPGRVVENVVQHQDEDHHGDGAEREHRAADTETGSEELQYRCLRLDVLRADRLVGRIEEVCRENDLPHAERDDEGRQLDP